MPPHARKGPMGRHRPAYTARVEAIRALVRRHGRADKARYSITLHRIRRRAGAWQRSRTFSTGQLPALTQVLAQVQAWLHARPDRQLGRFFPNSRAREPAPVVCLCAPGTPLRATQECDP